MAWAIALRRRRRPAPSVLSADFTIHEDTRRHKIKHVFRGPSWIPYQRWLGGLMRSLTAKLTLAFLLVGLTGAILVAVLVGQRTRSEFDRFLSEHDQATLVQALSSYYAAQNSWSGVGGMLARTPPLDF